MNRWSLLTWKDVDRVLELNNAALKDAGVTDFDVYPDCVEFSIARNNEKQAVIEALSRIVNIKNRTIPVAFGDALLIDFVLSDESSRQPRELPLFRDVVYRENEAPVTDAPLDVPIIAFDSYKGGVGRTLSLLAFARAWAELDAEQERKLLIIDSDIEAPGLSWLISESQPYSFSYLDLLECAELSALNEQMEEEIADRMFQMTIHIASDHTEADYLFLPTYRYREQLLDMYTRPEHIAANSSAPYALTDFISHIGKKLGVSAVLIDLRAGISEFSAPILFDSRVKKYLVSSTSNQSVMGTRMILELLMKSYRPEITASVPELLLTMVPKGLDTSDIKNTLLQAYEKSGEISDENSLLANSGLNLITECEFGSELVHLEGIDQITERLKDRGMYRVIFDLVKTNYFSEEADKLSEKKRLAGVEAINTFAKKQITAEGEGNFYLLQTRPISNLARRFRNQIPNAVVMGAKGSGKTFLYKKIVQGGTWEAFSGPIAGSGISGKSYIMPLLATANDAYLGKSFADQIKQVSAAVHYEYSSNFLSDNRGKIIDYLETVHSREEWRHFWLQLLLPPEVSSVSAFDGFLQKTGINILYIVDGLEDVFQNVSDNANQRNAVSALCQETLSDIRNTCSHIGLLIFARKDLLTDSIPMNFQQFFDQYKDIFLNWTSAEALRLALWIADTAMDGALCQGKIKIETASDDVIRDSLTKLWGLKLGRDDSNEAYASRWILAALSDFNGQLQARDIIRFLEYATERPGAMTYKDRYIMPPEIRNAVPACSREKIDEITQEIRRLQPIIDAILRVDPIKRILPFQKDTFNFTHEQEEFLKQEGYLIIDGDDYYIPEILRHALKFRYNSGARPRVLSLMNKK